MVTAPTCTEAGYTTYTCHCGDSYVADATDATGHDYSEVVVTAPTCTEGGYTTYTCHCGDSYDANETEATGHDYSEIDVIAPTCTTEGYTIHTCPACGDSYTDTTTATAPHSLVYDSANKLWDCSVCHTVVYELSIGENVYSISTDANAQSIDITVRFANAESGKYKVTTTSDNVLAIFEGMRLCDSNNYYTYEFELTEDTLDRTFTIGNANRNPNRTNDIYIVVEKVQDVKPDPNPGTGNEGTSVSVTVSDEQGMGMFQVTLEAGTYVFTVDQPWDDATVVVCDLEGNPVSDFILCGTEFELAAGEYIVCVGRASEGLADGVAFTITYSFTPSAPDSSCTHNWQEATCDQPSTCTICGDTDGEALGHTEETIPAVDADCTNIGFTEGTKCSVCGEILVAQTEIDELRFTEEANSLFNVIVLNSLQIGRAHV